MKSIALILVIYSFLVSCKHSGTPTGDAGMGIYLHYIDSSGNDLFSPYNDGQNSFWIDSVVVSNIETGSNYVSLDCFNSRSVSYQFEQFVVFTMKVCPNYNLINQYTYTLIQLKKGMVDTLKTHINQSSISSSTLRDSIWYNRVLRTYDSNATIPIIR
jgi:hypothetical protein